jgi:flagellar basal-body rod protein FlgB
LLPCQRRKPAPNKRQVLLPPAGSRGNPLPPPGLQASFIASDPSKSDEFKIWHLFCILSLYADDEHAEESAEMPISFDNALGIHADALLLRAKRAEVLANNIVNADTPNYKARDLDFKTILAGQASSAVKMANTQTGHNAGLISPDFAAELMYRTPLQPSIDGNTVDVDREQAAYAENAVAYQASFTFLSRKFSGLSAAIKGQ